MSEPVAIPAPPRPLHVLVVDDEINVRKTLAVSLETDGHRVVAVSNAPDAVAEAARQPFDLAFVDLRLGTTLGIDLIPQLLAQSAWTQVVIITAHGSIDTAVETMRRGAADYLTKPFTPAQVRLVVERVSRLRVLEQRVAGLSDAAGADTTGDDLESLSPAVRSALGLARQAAATDTTVLIRGESGTGKGVLAKAVHRWSPRAQAPFATVSAPTLSQQLLESELFGHARGSFTGATRDNPGRVAACDGGTLFLDEIGDLPMGLQPKLLRFVQDREYERVGESRTRRADVRMVVATNVDLEAAVHEGRFREDLLYRINVVQVDLPPLRDRAQDIPQLAARFLRDFARARPIDGFTAEAMTALQAYRWPGNIRELRNVIERSVILNAGGRIGLVHLPAAIAAPFTGPARSADGAIGDRISLDQVEEMHIRRVLARAASLDDAAKVLGIDVATLWRRRKKYGI